MLYIPVLHFQVTVMVICKVNHDSLISKKILFEEKKKTVCFLIFQGIPTYILDTMIQIFD